MRHEGNPITRFLGKFHHIENAHFNFASGVPTNAEIESYRRLKAQNIMNAENAFGFPTNTSQEALQKILTAPSSEIATMMMNESSTKK